MWFRAWVVPLRPYSLSLSNALHALDMCSIAYHCVRHAALTTNSDHVASRVSIFILCEAPLEKTERAIQGTSSSQCLPSLVEQTVIIVDRVETLMAPCRMLKAEIKQACNHAAHSLQDALKEAFDPI